MKKAQVTTFIIAGLVIFLFAAFVFFAFSARKPLDTMETSSIQVFVEQCLKDSTEDAITLLSIQGGRIYFAERFLKTDYSEIAYSFYEPELTLVTKEEMQSEISRYIEQAMPLCTRNFSSFTLQGFKINSEEISAETLITNDNVFVELTYPLEIKRINSTAKISTFNSRIPSLLGSAYNALGIIAQKTKDEPGWIDMSFLSDSYFDITVIPFNETVMIYSLSQELPGEDYNFISAMGFKLNLAPVFNIPESITAKRGERFTMQLDVTEPELQNFECTDDSPLFEISDGCSIDFTPEVTGLYTAIITATDSTGKFSEKKMQIKVE